MASASRLVEDALRDAGHVDPNLRELVWVLDVHAAAVGVSTGAAGVPAAAWVRKVVSILRALEPSERDQWDGVACTLESFVSADVAESVHCSASELVGLAELADLVDVCGRSNRAASHARDRVGRFFQKSIRQGSLFRDVRVTPVHFDEVVSLTVSHELVGSRGPIAIPPSWRIFAALFWLAQGGLQRVIARAVDVAESTFGKFCAPLIQAMLRGLPGPIWPDAAERGHIALKSSRLKGGDSAGWAGLYVSHGHASFSTTQVWR